MYDGSVEELSEFDVSIASRTSSRAYEDFEQRAQIRGTSSPETPGTSSDRDTARPPKKKQRKRDQDEISNLITTAVTTLKDINTTEHEGKGKHMLFGQ